MPHRCTECGKEFVDGDMQILKGCECGNNKFLYVPKKREEEEKEEAVDVEEKAEEVKNQIAEEMGMETVRIVAPGQYEINLDKVLSREEIIISLQQDGKYLIHLPSLLRDKRLSKKSKKKRE
ncbi:MAG: Zn-ribbon domain-containing protein [Archaeoglobaceae archaeon]